MDLRRVITAAPMLRRLWRVVPGPLRFPLLAVAAAVWLYRKLTGRGETGDRPQRSEVGAPASAGDTGEVTATDVPEPSDRQ